jgi:hypothetical protein
MSFTSTGGTGNATASNATSLEFASQSNTSFNPNTAFQASATFVATGLSAVSHTFTAQYEAGGGTCTFANRSMTVIPLP